MGYAGMVSRDFIDKNIGDGLSYGWSPISPRIHYSEHEKKIAQSWGISKIDELSNIENIVFFDSGKNKADHQGKTELIHKWRYVTERRLNILLSMKRKLFSQVSILSLQASISETERAHENVLHILSEDTDAVYFSAKKDHSDDNYEQVFAGELLGRLLAYFKNVDDNKNAKDIIHDLKSLVAIVIQTKDSEGDFRCSDSVYIDFLKKLELKYIDQECDECRIETIFTDFKFCVVCGRRL